MNTPMLQVNGLRVAYGSVVAVREVSLTLEAGQTMAVLGANGAGKTSLLRAISGLEPARAGTVTIDGVDVTGMRPEKIAGMQVAHVPDNRGIFPTLSVGENLRMGIYGAGRDGTEDAAADLEDILDMFPILRERTTQPAGNLSGGQQQMLTIGRSLLQRPRLLMLDEMSMGLAPSIVEELFVVIGELKQRGITVVLVEQFVGQAMGVADRVLVLEQGRVIAEGTPDELAGDDLAAAYLGGEDEVDLGELPPARSDLRTTVSADVDSGQLRRLQRIARERGVTLETLIGQAAANLDAEADA